MPGVADRLLLPGRERECLPFARVFAMSGAFLPIARLLLAWALPTGRSVIPGLSRRRAVAFLTVAGAGAVRPRRQRSACRANCPVARADGPGRSPHHRSHIDRSSRPRASRALARFERAPLRAILLTPISVRRLTASTVPSPMRLPKPWAAPSSGGRASSATRAWVSDRRNRSQARTCSRSTADGDERITRNYPIAAMKHGGESVRQLGRGGRSRCTWHGAWFVGLLAVGRRTLKVPAGSASW